MIRRTFCYCTLAVLAGLGGAEAGSRIAFSSQRDGSTEIYVMDSGGNNLEKITDKVGVFVLSPASRTRLSWSPDGSRLAYGSISRGNREVHVLDVATGNATNLSDHPDNDVNPAWSPDGARLLFETDRDGDDEIYMMNIDGARITFSSNRDGDQEIYVMNVDGSDPVRVTDNPAADFGPAWSPDGMRIAFTSRRDGPRQIYVIDADGSNVRRLTHSGANDSVPSWSPDGRFIVYASGGGSETSVSADIYVIDIDSGTTTNLTNRQGIDFAPAWAPGAPSSTLISAMSWGWVKAQTR